MKCTDVTAKLELLQKQVEHELIEAVRAHGSDEYVFFNTLDEFASISDGPFVMVEEPNNEPPIVRIEYNLWIVSRVSVAFSEIEIYGFRFEGSYEDDDEAELMGYVKAKELEKIIKRIPEITDINKKQSTMTPLYRTNYSVAVNWLNNNYVLCNNIPDVDPTVWENFLPLVDLSYEPEFDEEGEEIVPKCSECGTELQQLGPNMECPNCGECEDRSEIFQWFISDCNKSDVEYLTENFGLIFTYSDLLDCYILCVTHFGTAWDYVEWVTKNPIAARPLGKKK